MTISFSPSTENYGNAVLTQPPLRVSARDVVNTGLLKIKDLTVAATALTTAGGSVQIVLPAPLLRAGTDGAIGLLQPGPLTISAGGSGDLVVSIGVGSINMTPLVINAVGTQIFIGTGALHTLTRVFGANVTAFGRLANPINLRALDAMPSIDKQALLLVVPGMQVKLEAVPSLPPLIINDTIKLGDEWFHQPTWVLLDQLGLNDFFGEIFNAIKRIADQIGFNDVLIARLRVVIAEIIGFHDDWIGALAASLRIRDRLGLGDSQTALVQSLMLVQSVFRLLDASLAPTKELIAEAIKFIDSIDADVLAKMLAGDQLGLSVAPANTLLLHAIVAEQLGLHVGALTILSLRKMLESGIEFAVTLSTGDEGYSTWVMNAESQAFSSYENYPFNSYAQIGDQIYGATDDGIYLLEGDDDAGDPIAARLRTGLMNFGSNQSKRMEKFYAGMTTDGTMLLRVVTTSPEGDKIAYTYRMNERPVQATQEKRISIGRGLQSVYWQFELMNEDGADFEIADMSLLPMVLASRVRRS